MPKLLLVLGVITHLVSSEQHL